MMDFKDLVRVTHPAATPYPYQIRVAEDGWTDVMCVPTGLGKTAAVVWAWLYRRLRGKADTPARLVYCLPMRVLVEQTFGCVEEWLARARPLFDEAGLPTPTCHLLMGGDIDAAWASQPEHPAILVGTQDMLLSRALMRGYGMSRYQWPIHFALLHNDAMWVFDEVQLMGPALVTSTQLEAFRRDPVLAPLRPSRSLWVSATLDPDWLDSVDFRPHREQLRVLGLTAEDRAEPAVQARVTAAKRLSRAESRLDADSQPRQAQAYLDALAGEVLSRHREGTQTLVIANTVARAQGLYQRLAKQATGVPLLLLHSRFRPQERRAAERALHQGHGPEGRIVVATQAVEAGVDISSRTLFSELAPWPSMVQRFGRCNRGGEYGESEVFWVDLDEGDDARCAPYSAADLAAARETLQSTASASPADLPAVHPAPAPGQVLRRRDFLDLFNTDPDLSGFDVDVSSFIRDAGRPQIQVFWREFAKEPGEQEQPRREELCPAAIRDVAERLRRATAWRWDPLAAQWDAVAPPDVRPGMTLLLRAADGGYDPRLGFYPAGKKPVPLVDSGPSDKQVDDRYDADSWSLIGRWVPLPEHLAHSAQAAERLAEGVALDETAAGAVVEAARWHDLGKAHEAFQRALRKLGDPDPPQADALWAKSGARGRLRYAVSVEGGDTEQQRPNFRHELASALGWLEHHPDHPQRDLIAYLIAAHHGKVRLGLRALPTEQEPPEANRLFARGVWQGDSLPAVQVGTAQMPETELRLDLMRLGDGPQGPSWTARTRGLLGDLGPFRLAWLEALVRIADWRASEKEKR